MDKDAFYFPHFSNARHDRQIRRIRQQLGIEGYGIFFMLLEILREQKNYCYPIDDIDLLADDFDTSKEKILVVIKTPGLFETVDELFFSHKFNSYMQPYLERKEHGRKAALARWGNARALPEQCEPNASKGKESKGKERKIKEKKVTTTAAPVIFFNGDILKIAVNVHEKFLSTYPKIEILEQYKKMDSWLLCHPEKRYKNFSAFANNWLARATPETVATEERNLNVTQRAVLESRRRRLAIEDNGQKELTNGS